MQKGRLHIRKIGIFSWSYFEVNFHPQMVERRDKIESGEALGWKTFLSVRVCDAPGTNVGPDLCWGLCSTQHSGFLISIGASQRCCNTSHSSRAHFPHGVRGVTFNSSHHKHLILMKKTRFINRQSQALS